jgi:hypothetical protein
MSIAHKNSTIKLYSTLTFTLTLIEATRTTTIEYHNAPHPVENRGVDRRADIQQKSAELKQAPHPVKIVGQCRRNNVHQHKVHKETADVQANNHHQ